MLDTAGGIYYTRGVEIIRGIMRPLKNWMAGYIMAELNIGSKLMILPGCRFEKEETEYFAYHIKQANNGTGIDANPDSVTTNRENTTWFPSLNMKFKATIFSPSRVQCIKVLQDPVSADLPPGYLSHKRETRDYIQQSLP